MPAFQDLTGQRFGRLTVIERAENGRKKQTRWLCLCECGKQNIVNAANLKNGATKSCGCLDREVARIRCTKHGLATSKIYKIFHDIKGRCFNPNNTGYRDYGARGITVCDRWLENIENFLEDMGNRPEGTSIDRIDVNGNYEPENCRWATREEQANNTRVNRFIEFNGKRMTLTQWAKTLNIGVQTLHSRLARGWSIEQALTTPLKH